jgi:hypothetical protein
MSSTEVTKPTKREVWIRGAWMIGFMVALALAQTLVNLIAVVQFVWLLVAGESNPRLAAFGGSLGRWAAEAVGFLTMASEEKPFPSRDWPSGA